MNKKIHTVIPGSVADRHGIKNSDEIISLNEKQDFDIIDFLSETSEDRYELLINRNGREKKITVKNPDWEPSGIVFEEITADSPRRCRNNCIFCFMDQMPKGLRDTLYFKDDDYRLSFLCGNYITLTNVSDDEINRMIQMKLSPINISVHATDPDLRISMVRNRDAGNLINQMRKLHDGKIEMNLQLVLCPGINDGDQLKKTLDDLLKLIPSVRSVSCVPVGLTKFRDDLYDLRLFNKEEASAVIGTINTYREKALSICGEGIFCASDEFYLLAEMPFPEDAYYEEYIQYENGVGMCRSFIDEIKSALSDDTLTIPALDATLVTGTLAYPVISAVVQKIIEKHPNCKLDVFAVRNQFFGESITVAGLVCGQDIIEQFKYGQQSNHLIIPSNMMKDQEELFLDDVLLSEIETKLNVRCVVSHHSGTGLMETLLNWEDKK